MATVIPIFPLELVLFPEEKLNLHIFEPRYRQLIKDVKTHDMVFGIPFFQTGKEMSYGTTASLLQIFKTHENGTMDIKTQGHRVFRIHQIHKAYQNKLYSGATVDFIESNEDVDPNQAEELSALVRQLYDLMKIDKPLPGFKDIHFSFKVGHHLGLSKNQELALLQINSESERKQFLINHIEKLIPVVIEMEDLRKKIEMNGHFKNLKPPKF